MAYGAFRIYGRSDNPQRQILRMASQPIETPKPSKIQIGKTIGFIKPPAVPGLPALKVHPNWFAQKNG